MSFENSVGKKNPSPATWRRHRCAAAPDMRAIVQILVAREPGLRAWRRHRDALGHPQLLVPCLDGPVAFARGRLQSLAIGDLDSSAAVADDACLLERVSHD